VFEDIHQVLDSVLAAVEPELTTRCKVLKEYGDVEPVQCMRSEICQVFMSLLLNAAQAMKDPGVISIRSGQDKSEAWIEIVDTGQGISPADLPHIFDPFFTTRPVGQGIGLGLAVAYAIVQRHHGRIEVVSASGSGTTARIWLPLAQPVEVPPNP
jgi:signal transduction histidine kinase